MDFVHREIVVECLPADIPEHITVDVTELMLHDGVRVRDLPTGGKWKPVSEPDMLIVHVVAPKVEAEPAPAEAAAVRRRPAPAEPEVIKKGKVEKDEKKRSRREAGLSAGRRLAGRAREAGRWPRQSRASVRGHPAQRRVRGGRPRSPARHGLAFETRARRGAAGAVARGPARSCCSSSRSRS